MAHTASAPLPPSSSLSSKKVKHTGKSNCTWICRGFVFAFVWNLLVGLLLGTIENDDASWKKHLSASTLAGFDATTAVVGILLNIISVAFVTLLAIDYCFFLRKGRMSLLDNDNGNGNDCITKKKRRTGRTMRAKEHESEAKFACGIFWGLLTYSCFGALTTPITAVPLSHWDYFVTFGGDILLFGGIWYYFAAAAKVARQLEEQSNYNSSNQLLLPHKEEGGKDGGSCGLKWTNIVTP